MWETDPSLRDNEDTTALADVWCALPKVVFSRTLDIVRATPASPRRHSSKRSPRRSTRPEKDVEIGGARLASAAIELGLVDELRIFRNPVLVGGGTPLLPPVTKHIPLDLVETRTFGSRVIYERYARAGDESDPPSESSAPRRIGYSPR